MCTTILGPIYRWPNKCNNYSKNHPSTRYRGCRQIQNGLVISCQDRCDKSPIWWPSLRSLPKYFAVGKKCPAILWLWMVKWIYSFMESFSSNLDKSLKITLWLSFILFWGVIINNHLNSKIHTTTSEDESQLVMIACTVCSAHWNVVVAIIISVGIPGNSFISQNTSQIPFSPSLTTKDSATVFTQSKDLDCDFQSTFQTVWGFPFDLPFPVFHALN